MLRVVHLLPHRGGGAETYVDLLERLPGVEHRRLALSTSAELSRAPSIALRWPVVARAVRAADVVHVHGDVASVLSMALLSKRPSVISTHGLHMLRRASPPVLSILRPALRSAIQRASVTVCTSPSERDELARLAPHLLDRLRLVENAVSLPPAAAPAERAAVRTELGVSEGDVLALFVGALDPRKGALVAAAAAKIVRTRGAPFALALAGDGPERERLRTLESAAVRPLGFRADTARLMSASDLFVLPSGREGLSFAVLEAMSHGLPVVVGDGPGNRDAVGDAGVFVPFGDTEALADTLAELVGDELRRNRLGELARARVAARFSLEVFLERFGKLYEELTVPGRDAAAERA